MKSCSQVCRDIREGRSILYIIKTDETWESGDIHWVATTEDEYWIENAKTKQALINKLNRRKLPYVDKGEE